MTLYETTTGLLINTNKPIGKLAFSDINNSRENSEKLIITEEDERAYEIFRSLKLLEEKDCNYMAGILNILKCREDTYLRFQTTESKDIILYLDNCMIFIPTCININEIEIVHKNQTQNNWRDLEVMFKLNNESRYGWLTDSNVITQQTHAVTTPRTIHRYLPKVITNLRTANFADRKF